MHRGVRNIYLTANTVYSGSPVAKKFNRWWHRHCRSDIRNHPEPRKTRRVTILSANKRRLNSILSRQQGRQLIVSRLASYAFSVSLLIKLKNVNKWWIWDDFLRITIYRESKRWLFISVFLGKLLLEATNLKDYSNCHGNLWAYIKLCWNRIHRIPKNARYHSSGKEDGYQLFHIFLEK